MPGENVYERLGVRRIINASSWRTNVGGSLMPPPVRRAMDEAGQWFVDLAELNARAGETIARLTGAEAGLVTAGSAAGMLLEAAACMDAGRPGQDRPSARYHGHEERDRHSPIPASDVRPLL